MWNIMKLLDLKVKLPMLVSIDNGGTMDIGKNWSMERRTCHMEVKQIFFLELKKQVS